MAWRRASVLILLFAWASTNALTTNEQRARELLAELVAIDTFRSGDVGRTREAADRLAARLISAGFPAEDVQVLGLTPGDGNLIARYRSTNPSQPPVILLAHLDTVSTSPMNWDTDPLQLIEKDGYYYGRGTRDIKDGAARLVANFLRLRAEGFRPNRDLIILLTADEETSGANVVWLLGQHRSLLDASFALNTDAGYVELTRDGQPVAFALQTAEKIYASFVLGASSPGGHSSRPTADNAIYKLARGLDRLDQYRFPRALNATARVYFERWAHIAPPALQAGARALGAGRLDDPAIVAVEAVPYLNALFHTTCVATQLSGGGSENALPERARALVNCRILPESSPEAVEQVLRDLVAADGVVVTPAAPAAAAPSSPLEPRLLNTIAAVAAEFWPGIPVLPEMSPGASDGVFLRAAGIPTYGVGAVPEDPDEDRSHAPNERIRIAAFHESMEFWYRLTKRLAE